MNVSFLQELLNSVAEQSRHLLPWAQGSDDDIVVMSQALMSGRGEASGVAIAREILDVYRRLDADGRCAFFKYLAVDLAPDPVAVKDAAARFLAHPVEAALARLQKVVESPRQEFFRRLNLAPGATAQIVGLRTELLEAMQTAPELEPVDADLRHLLGSWFNRGFLVMRRIDWQTPAAILEKIIAYEAVHEIKGWEDLRRRLEPSDRRCFAFFHPSLVDEPLIFVEVALTHETPAAISEVLGETVQEAPASGRPLNTAVFYSISNCQRGLAGISFGNFLIKQVVEDLVRDCPSLTTFVTLSPVPGFARWLAEAVASGGGDMMTAEETALARGLTSLETPGADADDAKLKPVVLGLAGRYLVHAKTASGRPLDPVARFHLGNGARLERINWRGDTSERGLREAHGVMVNYLYDLKEIERNHEAFANESRVVASRAVQQLARLPQRRRAALPLLEGPQTDGSVVGSAAGKA